MTCITESGRHSGMFGRDLMKMNGALVANPDVADAPAITIPETLPLPDAGFAVAGIDDIGWAAIAWETRHARSTFAERDSPVKRPRAMTFS